MFYMYHIFLLSVGEEWYDGIIYAQLIKIFPKAGVWCLQEALMDMFQEADVLSAYCLLSSYSYYMCVVPFSQISISHFQQLGNFIFLMYNSASVLFVCFSAFSFFVMAIHKRIRWDMVCILFIHWFGIRIWCLCPFVLLLPWNKAHFSESAKYFQSSINLQNWLFLLLFFLLANYNLVFVCSSFQFKSLTLGSWKSLLH